MHTHQKGIVFKQNTFKRIMLLEPETFFAYLETLTPTKTGKIILNFIFFEQPTLRNLFAKISQTDLSDIPLTNPRSFNFIKYEDRHYLVIHLDTLNHFFRGKEPGWHAFNFIVRENKSSFADITPLPYRRMATPMKRND